MIGGLSDVMPPIFLRKFWKCAANWEDEGVFSSGVGVGSETFGTASFKVFCSWVEFTLLLDRVLGVFCSAAAASRASLC